jgi:hypothetical protein
LIVIKLNIVFLAHNLYLEERCALCLLCP